MQYHDATEAFRSLPPLRAAESKPAHWKLPAADAGVGSGLIPDIHIGHHAIYLIACFGRAQLRRTGRPTDVLRPIVSWMAETDDPECAARVASLDVCKDELKRVLANDRKAALQPGQVREKFGQGSGLPERAFKGLLVTGNAVDQLVRGREKRERERVLALRAGEKSEQRQWLIQGGVAGSVRMQSPVMACDDDNVTCLIVWASRDMALSVQWKELPTCQPSLEARIKELESDLADQKGKLQTAEGNVTRLAGEVSTATTANARAVALLKSLEGVCAVCRSDLPPGQDHTSCIMCTTCCRLPIRPTSAVCELHRGRDWALAIDARAFDAWLGSPAAQAMVALANGRTPASLVLPGEVVPGSSVGATIGQSTASGAADASGLALTERGRGAGGDASVLTDRGRGLPPRSARPPHPSGDGGGPPPPHPSHPHSIVPHQHPPQSIVSHQHPPHHQPLHSLHHHGAPLPHRPPPPGGSSSASVAPRASGNTAFLGASHVRASTSTIHPEGSVHGGSVRGGSVRAEVPPPRGCGMRGCECRWTLADIRTMLMTEGNWVSEVHAVCPSLDCGHLAARHSSGAPAGTRTPSVVGRPYGGGFGGIGAGAGGGGYGGTSAGAAAGGGGYGGTSAGAGAGGGGYGRV